MRRTKALLLALLLVGAVASFGANGTFSSFSAETTNAGNSIASGTLTLSNSVNSGTACVSASAASANNLDEGCSAVLNLTNVGPGAWNAGLQTATVTVTNTGSIGASKLYLWAPSFTLSLATALTSGSPVSQLTVTSVPFAIASGDSLVLSDGSNTETFTTTAAYLPSSGQTNLSVTSASGTANANYSTSATTITDSTQTGCHDTRTTAGTGLNFNTTTGNPLCGSALLYVEETTGGHDYCWIGNGSSPESQAGACTTPVSVDLTSALSPANGSITTLPVTSLNGTIQAKDSITLTCPVETTLTSGLTQGSSVASLAVTSVPAAISAGDPIALQTQDTAALSSGLTQGTLTSSIPVGSVPLAVSANDPIVVSNGAETQTFVASAAVTATAVATSIPVTPEVANFSYTTSATVTDQTAWQVTQVFFATSAVAATTSAATIQVTPQNASANFPATTGATGSATTVTDQLPTAWAPITQTFTASGSAYPGTTTGIPVNSQAPTAACPAGSAVVDATAANTLNSDTTNTISDFYTAHGTTGKVQLYPVVGNGQINTGASVELAPGATRTFQIGLYLPAPTGLNQNDLQGLQSTFDMTWHADQ